MSTDKTTISYQIRGYRFEAPRRFAAGHQLTESEALALDRFVIEACRPALTARVDSALHLPLGELQTVLSQHLAAYQFPASRSDSLVLAGEIQTIAYEWACLELEVDEEPTEDRVFELMEHPGVIQAARQSLALKARLAAHAISDLMP